MSRESVTITDRATDDQVEAVLDTDFPLVHLVDAEIAWSPYRLEAIRNFLMRGRTGPLPEHCHWNWAQKALPFETARHRVLAIEAAGQVQGLMWVWLRDHTARVPPDLAGRVGLHSLPQSEVCYASACGMHKVGIDAAYHDLTYFEYTAAAATTFLDG